jgi:hypothetical protein
MGPFEERRELEFMAYPYWSVGLDITAAEYSCHGVVWKLFLHNLEFKAGGMRLASRAAKQGQITFRKKIIQRFVVENKVVKRLLNNVEWNVVGLILLEHRSPKISKTRAANVHGVVCESPGSILGGLK